MVYTFMNYDDFNSKYNDILKIATCYSEWLTSLRLFA